jgi:flagellar L-ring protein precursor FlgH
MRIRWIGTWMGIAAASTTAARAQSSSLFQEGEEHAARRAAASQPARTGALADSAGATPDGRMDVNEPLNQTSYLAVAPPPPRSFRVNDAVTIIVLERIRYRSDNQNQQDRRWDLQWELKEWFRIVDRKWVQQPFTTGNPQVETSLSDRRVGNGRSNRQDEFTTRITARVIDVKPNGQLVLQATRTIQYDEEEQTVTLIGSCRGQDVTADNSVLSTQVMDLELRTQNSGQIRDASKRGWLLRLLDFGRPF